MIRFDPQPAATDVPARFPSPFDRAAVHPLARRAADELVALLRGQPSWGLDAPGGGKMFGVLVVAAPDGQVGYLRAFSGMLDGRWDVDGFAPPAFDAAARDAFWIDGEAEMRARADELRALAEGTDAVAVRGALAALTARHAADDAELRARHARNRADRHARRATLEPAMHALAQESRADTAELRRLQAARAAESAAITARVAALDTRIAALTEARAERSRHLLRQIHDTYAFTSARGERRTLRQLFAPEAPPGGAGDCAAPKLLVEATRRGLRPIALAELWWGAPPRTGGRHAGAFYPACRGKCGAILPHLLDGLDGDPAPLFGAARIADDEPHTRFEDPWLAVVAKPCGLLSVPGRSGLLRDSVLTRLRRRYPDATGPLLIHRLDLDTSGLLLAARDEATYTALQRAFARREIDKRYIAWLDGDVVGDHGVIELALRVDLDDRPRQLHDPVYGKPAVTSWRVLARDGGRTRVELTPHTGRTHQLRVHAAHPLGLAAPIVGDRLYGRDADPDERLLLHAEALAFVHPHTGARISVEEPAPF